MAQTTELAKRQQAGKAFHGSLQAIQRRGSGALGVGQAWVEAGAQNSPGRISPTAMPSSAKSALPF
ncbi:hypothetical protein DLM46_05690 [Paraburkholderia lacunae]|uniref:Uncharacterized protein n=1 Tax=Paraburkholderia lacunae TaxID=2211104 RepID=A0A370NDM6_9BURK|nr:hypothetical protein DLM46_05690 [Paraburkholderia lacunae]